MFKYFIIFIIYLKMNIMLNRYLIHIFIDLFICIKLTESIFFFPIFDLLHQTYYFFLINIKIKKFFSLLFLNNIFYFTHLL